MDPQLATTAPLSQVLPKGPSVVGTPAQQARLVKAKDVSQKFEAVFIQQMLNLSNNQNADQKDSFNGGFGEQMYRQMLNEQTATAIAAHGGVGLANNILKQMAQRGDIPPLQNPAQAQKTYQGMQ